MEQKGRLKYRGDVDWGLDLEGGGFGFSQSDGMWVGTEDRVVCENQFRSAGKEKRGGWRMGAGNNWKNGNVFPGWLKRLNESSWRKDWGVGGEGLMYRE